MLMMLDITDALPLILEGSGRRTELQIPAMLALLFALRSLWQRRDGYSTWKGANRNGRNYGVGRGVDDRDGVAVEKRHVRLCSIRCNGYPTRSSDIGNAHDHHI